MLERARSIAGRRPPARGGPRRDFVVAENRRIAQDLIVPAKDCGKAKPGDRRRRDRRVPDRRARADRARRRVLAARPTRASRSRSRCASTTCRSSSKAAAAAAKRLPRECGTPSEAVDLRRAAARHDRRRVREGLRRRGLLRAQRQRAIRLVVAIADVSHYVKDGDAIDRDARASARRRSTSAPRDPDAARGAVRTSSARSGPKSTGSAWSPTWRSPRPAGSAATVLPGGDALARGSPTPVWAWLSTRRPRRTRAKALLPHLADAPRALPPCSRPPRQTRRDRPRPSSSSSCSTRHGKIEKRSSGAAQRRAQMIEECMLAANVSAADLLARPGTRRSTACTRADA